MFARRVRHELLNETHFESKHIKPGNLFNVWSSVGEGDNCLSSA